MKSLIESRIAALEADNKTLTNGALILTNYAIIRELKALIPASND